MPGICIYPLATFEGYHLINHVVNIPRNTVGTLLIIHQNGAIRVPETNSAAMPSDTLEMPHIAVRILFVLINRGFSNADSPPYPTQE